MIPLEDIGKSIGPIALSMPENIPGLFEKVELVDPTNPTEIQAEIPLSILSEFTAQSGIWWSESLTGMVFRGKESYSTYLKKGSFSRLKDRLLGITVLEEFEESCFVPIIEIHCPKVNGCHATYIQKTTNSKDYYFELTIAGFGGGAGKSRKIGLGMEIPVKESCLTIYAPIDLHLELCEKRTGEQFQRVSILNIRDGFNAEYIPSERDSCQLSLDRLNTLNWKPAPWKGLYSDKPTVVTEEIEMGKKWKPLFGIEFEKVGLSFEFNITSQVLKFYQCKYSLFGPHTYHSYNEPNTFGYRWTW